MACKKPSSSFGPLAGPFGDETFNLVLVESNDLFGRGTFHLCDLTLILRYWIAAVVGIVEGSLRKRLVDALVYYFS